MCILGFAKITLGNHDRFVLIDNVAYFEASLKVVERLPPNSRICSGSRKSSTLDRALAVKVFRPVCCGDDTDLEVKEVWGVLESEEGGGGGVDPGDCAGIVEPRTACKERHSLQ